MQEVGVDEPLRRGRELLGKKQVRGWPGLGPERTRGPAMLLGRLAGSAAVGRDRGRDFPQEL